MTCRKFCSWDSIWEVIASHFEKPSIGFQANDFSIVTDVVVVTRLTTVQLEMANSGQVLIKTLRLWALKREILALSHSPAACKGKDRRIPTLLAANSFGSGPIEIPDAIQWYFRLLLCYCYMLLENKAWFLSSFPGKVNHQTLVEDCHTFSPLWFVLYHRLCYMATISTMLTRLHR